MTIPITQGGRYLIPSRVNIYYSYTRTCVYFFTFGLAFFAAKSATAVRFPRKATRYDRFRAQSKQIVSHMLTVLRPERTSYIISNGGGPGRAVIIPLRGRICL